MNPHYSPTSTVEHPEARNRSEKQLQGPWLVLARIAWCVVLLLVVGIVIASIPPYFAYLHTLTGGVVVDLSQVQLTHDGVHALHALGLSIDFFAVFTIVLNALFVFGFVLIGAVLFWRKADDRLALYTSFALVAFPINFIFSQTTTLPPAWSFPVQCIAFLGGTSFDIFCYLFPSGRFVPPWTRWLIIGWVIFEGSGRFFPSSPFNPNAGFPALGFGLFFPLLASIVAVQIYRYRCVSTPLERQQTKWVVFGFTLGILGLIGTILLSLLFPVFFQTGTLAYFVLYPVFLLSPLCMPISIGIAILRSRLWDIDVIINRTLVYGTLTTTLALIYVGLIITLQGLLRGIFNQTSDVAIVASTLAIAALFQPLRQRVQRFVDRRFYRSKYDTAKIVAAYSATLRQEVDLDQLREQLLAVVQETMQPAHVSLWVRKPEQDGKRSSGITNALVSHSEEMNSVI